MAVGPPLVYADQAYSIVKKQYDFIPLIQYPLPTDAF